MVDIPKFARTSNFHLTKTILEAGKAIMDIFNSDFEVIQKDDLSPLTQADLEANRIITEALLETNIPVISEESELPKYSDRKNWNEFWIIDPIDGTKEFVKRGTDFTVNLARIVNSVPVEGYIYAPATNTFYWGEQNKGAYKYSDEEGFQVLPIHSPSQDCIVASKSHYNEQTRNFILSLLKEHPNLKMINIGSSLKFCLIAEGSAKIYPRIGQINEWDIAAGDAIVRASGSHTINASTSKSIDYNSRTLKTPNYIVGNNIELIHKIIELLEK